MTMKSRDWTSRSMERKDTIGRRRHHDCGILVGIWQIFDAGTAR
jgi:hypothetical protein